MAGRRLNSLHLHQKSHYCRGWKQGQEEEDDSECVCVLCLIVYVSCKHVCTVYTLSSAVWADPSAWSPVSAHRSLRYSSVTDWEAEGGKVQTRSRKICRSDVERGQQDSLQDLQQTERDQSRCQLLCSCVAYLTVL